MVKLCSVLPAVALLLAGPSLSAKVSVASLFQDGAVLQQRKNVPVWGKANAGESVTVSFNGQTLTTTADAQGRWRVDLAPMEVVATAMDLVIAGSSNVVTRTNVVVGEVWLCSGQSNMVWPLSNSEGGKQAAAGAGNYPLIRLFKVGTRSADKPETKAGGTWRMCSPKTASGMSGVAFFFARDLYHEIGVPIGIIQTAVDGSQIEAWLSEDSLKGDPALTPVYQRYTQLLAGLPASNAGYKQAQAAWNEEQKAAKAAGVPFDKPRPQPPLGPGNTYRPVGLYNGMIYPLIPYALRGAVWYQGESNADRPEEYRTLLPTLMKLWRTQWGQGDFPFLVVQLPSFGETPISFAPFREVQAAATASQPNAALAVTLDLGEPHDLHPKNKLDVGLRLARIAKAKIYGRTNLEYSGPVYKDLTRDGDTLRVRFDHAEGLDARGGRLTGFEIAGDDRNYVPAKGDLGKDGTVTLTSKKVPTPRYVRYGWNVAGPNLYNAAGLPAAPFRAEIK